jgi:hypothetical protein
MSDYPDLTIGICTYKRPWYAAMTLNQCKQIRYAGKVKFHIADGGSNPEDFVYFKQILSGHEVTFSQANNLASMVNACARWGGDLWITAMDDLCPRRSFDITPDVRLLLEHPEIGCVRFSRLAFWGNGGDSPPDTTADLVTVKGSGLHWWRIDKARTKDNYSCNMGFHLYHRRFWDCYGDIPPCAPDHPGDGEHNGLNRYNARDGVTIAIPMRFGQDSADTQEFIWHFGIWRTDEYAKNATTGRL